MARRIVIAGVVLVLIAAGLAWHYDLPAKLGLTAGKPTELTLYGNVDIRQVELGFRVAGRISEMKVEEGDKVTKGTVLAKLDERPFLDAIDVANADIAKGEADLKKFQTGSRPQEIAQAKAALAEREATLANANSLVERRQALVKEGVTSRQSYDDAVAAQREASARAAAARESLNLVNAGFRIEDIEAAKAALASAQARLEQSKTSLADSELIAPDNGVVLTKVREPGAIVMAGASVYTLSLIDPVWVRAYVSEPDLGRIAPGMKAEVITDSAPDKPYGGQIGFISPVAEFTPKTVETPDLRSDLVYRLRIVVANPDQRLRQGMPVTVRLPDAPPPAKK